MLKKSSVGAQCIAPAPRLRGRILGARGSLGAMHCYLFPKEGPPTIILCLLIFLLAACSGTDTGSQATPTPSQPRVNGFGTAVNHVHSLLALPHNVLELATHYGLFRSPDGGSSWTEVAGGGTEQQMSGLMTFSLGISSVNSQRMYVLTQPRASNIPYTGKPGLYTSADQGQTWQLAVTSESMTGNPNIYFFLETPGNTSPDEVFVYNRNKGTTGLAVSKDDGQHFTNTGTLPFSIQGLITVSGTPGHLLGYGSDGVAASSDDGAHWQVVKSVQGGVYDMAEARANRPNSPIYASGDNGISVSTDGGKTFTSRNIQISYTSLTVSPSQPNTVYGKTGLATYRSSDGGRTWKALPHISGNLGDLVVNPTDPAQVYLSLSYPTAVYTLTSANGQWKSLTPKA